jgi:hypothetical protein
MIRKTLSPLLACCAVFKRQQNRTNDAMTQMVTSVSYSSVCANYHFLCREVNTSKVVLFPAKHIGRLFKIQLTRITSLALQVSDSSLIVVSMTPLIFCRSMSCSVKISFLTSMNFDWWTLTMSQPSLISSILCGLYITSKNSEYFVTI